jgi:hypothetical protein
VNRVGVLVLAAAVLLCGGALAASGAFVPFTAGPGYDPTAAPGLNETGTTQTEATAARATATEGRYDHATVTVVDENGTELGSVRVAIADTAEKRYTGLSDTEFLPEDRGMLFTYDSEGQRTYVMRGMDFGIDIVYIGADGTIRTIHHAPEPPAGEDGNDYRYPGEGKYVLEVNYEWTTRHNVTEGDRVLIEGL